jgi:hypothetical protein
VCCWGVWLSAACLQHAASRPVTPRSAVVVSLLRRMNQQCCLSLQCQCSSSRGGQGGVCCTQCSYPCCSLKRGCGQGTSRRWAVRGHAGGLAAPAPLLRRECSCVCCTVQRIVIACSGRWKTPSLRLARFAARLTCLCLPWTGGNQVQGDPSTAVGDCRHRHSSSPGSCLGSGGWWAVHALQIVQPFGRTTQPATLTRFSFLFAPNPVLWIRPTARRWLS